MQQDHRGTAAEEREAEKFIIEGGKGKPRKNTKANLERIHSGRPPLPTSVIFEVRTMRLDQGSTLMNTGCRGRRRCSLQVRPVLRLHVEKLSCRRRREHCALIRRNRRGSHSKDRRIVRFRSSMRRLQVRIP